MQAIFTEILKPEENLGFNPGEPDDDTFLLETQGIYPAPIPNFDQEQQNTKQLDTVPDNKISEISAEIIEPPKEGSVWDVFEQEQSKSEPATQIEQREFEEITELQSENITTQEEQIELVEIEENGTTVEESREYLFANEIEVVEEIPQFQEERIESVAPESNESLSSIALDQVLLQDLQKELEISNTKKAKKQKDNVPTEHQKPIIDEGAPEVFIVLNDIKVEGTNKENTTQPIENIIQETPVEKETEEITGKIAKKDKKIKEKTSTKKEKIHKLDKDTNKEKTVKRKFIPHNFFKYASIFLFFVVFGLSTYYIWDTFGYKKTQDLIQLAKNNVFGNETKKETEIDKKQEKPIKKSINDKQNTEEKSSQETANVAPQAQIQKPEEKSLKITQENIVREEPKDELKQIRTVTKNISKEPKEVKKPAKLSTPKENKADKIFASNIVTTQPKISSITKNDEEQTFTIQVYSTPSLEDAENWVKNLRIKYNIDNVYITPQTVRDRIWYRVRFGYFSSFEEARTTALKYGFSQSWIDRIK